MTWEGVKDLPLLLSETFPNLTRLALSARSSLCLRLEDFHLPLLTELQVGSRQLLMPALAAPLDASEPHRSLPFGSQLTRFAVFCDGLTGEHWLPWLRDADSLQWLEVWCGMITAKQLKQAPTFRNVTHLTLFRMYVDELATLDALSDTFPALETLNLAEAMRSDATPIPRAYESAWLFPSLKRLSLRYFPPRMLCRIWCVACRIRRRCWSTSICRYRLHHGHAVRRCHAGRICVHSNCPRVGHHMGLVLRRKRNN